MKTEKQIEVKVDWKNVVESYMCDQCRKTSPPRYPNSNAIPKGWSVAEMESDYGYGDHNDDECHFCSAKCMKEYLLDTDYFEEYTLKISGDDLKILLG